MDTQNTSTGQMGAAKSITSKPIDTSDLSSIQWGKCQEPGCTNTCAANSTICYDHVADMWIDPE